MAVGQFIDKKMQDVRKIVALDTKMTISRFLRD